MNKMLSMSQKTIIATGVTGGIGAHLASMLASNNANLVLVARNKDKLDELLSNLRKVNVAGEYVAIAADVTLKKDVEKVIGIAFEKFGSVDGLVNIAGVGNTSLSYELSESDWQNVFDSNLKSIWLLTSGLVNKMRVLKKEGCSVVNISSALAQKTKEGRAAYATSKAAVEHLTRQLALELAPFGVRVNAVSPGYFRTSMNAKFLDSAEGLKTIRNIPLQRTGSLSELDFPILLLLSDASSYITGATIAVDGGLCVNKI